MGFMRILRILRLVRLLRIVRVMRYIAELRAIVLSIAGSMRSLLWTIALLFLIMYIIGIVFTQIFADYTRDVGITGAEGLDDEDEEALRISFGSLLRSILSLYEAISGGKDWDDLVTPLIALNPFFGLIFVFYIAFALLALMNVVTGVFVEAALKSAKDDEEKSMLESLNTLFCTMADDGVMKLNQFEEMVDDPEMAIVLKSLDLVPEETKALFMLMDMDDSGEIDYEEFLNGCLKLRGPAKSIDLTTVMHENRKTSRKLVRHAHKIETLCESILDKCSL
eukprot:gnl/TRDRNA2_/TRDRNA2_170626_c0_seq1.p1 gnl/TRDRNA2_/TRDRNA2_170626_c0~~gnl/TRDRNA2_/TRDRNA2_170626_c0_seq1.p1  ORF type:complete len:308 (-),score=66.17 gnl/TRDRNA2_/TRDRNA2_170626_c0_seq1:299-1138(-)